MKRNPWIIAATTVALVFATLAYPPLREPLARFELRSFVEALGKIGPIPFFAALGVLPALWFPVSPFLILAGALYPLDVAIGGGLAALAVNMALTWLLSGRWLRPFFDRLATRLGRRPPELTRANMVRVTLLMRIAPGIPFALQNYLLGLARVPFVWYMGISLLPVYAYALGFILLGEALLTGETFWVLAGATLLTALWLAAREARSRLRERRAEASTP